MIFILCLYAINALLQIKDFHVLSAVFFFYWVESTPILGGRKRKSIFNCNNYHFCQTIFFSLFSNFYLKKYIELCTLASASGPSCLARERIVVCESSAFNYPLIKQGWQEGEESGHFAKISFATTLYSFLFCSTQSTQCILIETHLYDALYHCTHWYRDVKRGEHRERVHAIFFCCGWFF